MKYIPKVRDKVTPIGKWSAWTGQVGKVVRKVRGKNESIVQMSMFRVIHVPWDCLKKVEQ